MGTFSYKKKLILVWFVQVTVTVGLQSRKGCALAAVAGLCCSSSIDGFCSFSPWFLTGLCKVYTFFFFFLRLAILLSKSVYISADYGSFTEMRCDVVSKKPGRLNLI